VKKNLFLLAMLSVYYISGDAQSFSQTRTANQFNNINEAYLDLWARKGTAYVSADDGSYAYSKTLTSNRGFLLLVLQDFGFNIPTDATIDNITVTARRFKNGKGSIKDYFATLVTNSNISTHDPYGVRWTDPTNYPDIETQVQYSQLGTGTNGGGQANQSYQWTPAMINHPRFGARIDTYKPSGSVIVYYDLVTITVAYTSSSLISPSVKYNQELNVAEAKALKQPTVYPNPFTAKSTIQFTAAETGNAVVQLYNISGEKIQTLFSGNVVKGQQYNVIAGPAQLAKGNYLFMISNGKQEYTGRIIKVE